MCAFLSLRTAPRVEPVQTRCGLTLTATCACTCNYCLLQDLMVGDEAAALRHGLEVTYPVDNGVIRNWDDMELLWNYTFSCVLRAPPPSPTPSELAQPSPPAALPCSYLPATRRCRMCDGGCGLSCRTARGGCAAGMCV
jgi:hypothetical protein